MTRSNDKPAKVKTSKKVRPLDRSADGTAGSLDVSRLLDAAMVEAAEDDEEFDESAPSSITAVLDQVVEDFKKEDSAPAKDAGQQRRKK